jgi:hypothetical protein
VCGSGLVSTSFLSRLVCIYYIFGIIIMAVSNTIFVNKIGSGTHRATQNLVGTGEVLVMLMAGKKKVLACILLRKDLERHSGLFCH